MNELRETTGYEGDRSGPPLLGVPEVLRRLRISRSTLYRLLAVGALEPVYLDRRPRFVPADVEQLIESRKARLTQ